VTTESADSTTQHLLRELAPQVLGAVARATVKELAEAIAARLEKTIAAGQAHGA